MKSIIIARLTYINDSVGDPWFVSKDDFYLITTSIEFKNFHFELRNHKFGMEIFFRIYKFEYELQSEYDNELSRPYSNPQIKSVDGETIEELYNTELNMCKNLNFEDVCYKNEHQVDLPFCVSCMNSFSVIQCDNCKTTFCTQKFDQYCGMHTSSICKYCFEKIGITHFYKKCRYGCKLKLVENSSQEKDYYTKKSFDYNPRESVFYKY